MKKALTYTEDEFGNHFFCEELNAVDFREARKKAQEKKSDLKSCCPECMQNVFLNNKLAGTFQAVNTEVTETIGYEKEAGFSHYQDNNGVYCSRYHPNDEAFDELRRKSKDRAGVDEIKRNIEAINKEGMREAIFIVQSAVMPQLTGEKEISKKDKKELKKIERMFLARKGFADYPFVLGFAGPLELGMRKRKWGKSMRRYEFTVVDTQELSVEGGKIIVPSRLRLDCITKDGSRHPAMFGRSRSIVEIPVSRLFARQAVAEKKGIILNKDGRKIGTIPVQQEIQALLNEVARECSQRKVVETAAPKKAAASRPKAPQAKKPVQQEFALAA